MDLPAAVSLVFLSHPLRCCLLHKALEEIISQRIKLWDGSWRMADGCFRLKVTKCKWGTIPLRIKCYAGLKVMSVKEKWGTESKSLRLGINKVNSSSSFTGSRAELHSWRSANTLAKFHLQKVKKNPTQLEKFWLVSWVWQDCAFDTPNTCKSPSAVNHQEEKRLQQRWLLLPLSIVLNHNN